MRLAFDIETDGLLPELTKIHCVCIQDVDSGEKFSYGPMDVPTAIDHMAEADLLIGHNILGFDIPALVKVYPHTTVDLVPVRDTLVMSRLIFPDLRDRDFAMLKRDPEYPKKNIGSHSLKAWGFRLNNLKQDYEGGWETWNEEMQEYCEQDVEVTVSLWNRLLSKEFSDESIDLEHEVARILLEQESHGFYFDTKSASVLYAELRARHSVLKSDLQRTFPAWEVHTPFTPKRNNKTKGYVAGETIYKTKEVEFNPDSRDHIALKLREEYGWKPEEYTENGKPKVDERILSGLKYPAAQSLTEYLLLTKRIGQLAEGPQAWLKKVSEKGLIHGRVNTNGAVTGRMTHSHPNLAQVPSTRAIYGKECRQLFQARPGKTLVGCDADALELRCLAGYLYHWDQGEYIRTVLEGDKAAGTDMHSVNARVLGCDRDTAKTWFYAFIYGAGVKKLGSILGGGPKRGGSSRRDFLRSLPALEALVTSVQRRVESRGYLIGIDGRKLYVRSSHAALNTLLQAAGAIFMKRGLVFCRESMGELGNFVANVHDEWQIECEEENADTVGRIAVESIRDAGKYYDFACPLDANYATGRTWADTH